MGQPMKMVKFLVTTDDCNMASNHTPIDTKLQALTHYVTMGAIRGWQRRKSMQQNHHTQCLAAFNTADTETQNICQCHDYSLNHNLGASTNHYVTNFSELDQLPSMAYIDLNDDMAMSAPKVQASTLHNSAVDLVTEALTNAGGLPHFETDNLSGLNAGPLDFSLLGNVNHTLVVTTT